MRAEPRTTPRAIATIAVGRRPNTRRSFQSSSLASGAPQQTMQMSELAAMTSAFLSRLSHAANCLEQQGYLTRSRCARRRRPRHERDADLRRPAHSLAVQPRGEGHVECDAARVKLKL